MYGNYSYIYGLVFVVLALIGKLYSKEYNKRQKTLFLIIIILSCITIFYAKFIISYGLLIIGILAILLNINSIKRSLIFVLISVVLILLFSGTIASICDNISNMTESYIIKSRIINIADILRGKDLRNIHESNTRIKVYEKSINAIANSPIIGMLSGKYKESGQVAGGHSAILDEIARLGLLSLPFFIVMCIIPKNILKTIDNTKGKSIYFVCIAEFYMLAGINTVMFVPLLWMLFVLTPIVCQNSFNKQAEKEEQFEIVDILKILNKSKDNMKKVKATNKITNKRNKCKK